MSEPTRQVQEVLPNLHTLEVKLPEFSVRAVVVVGERFTVVWDTLTRPEDMAALGPLLGDRPVYVIYSHADWDHVWGTQGLAQAPVGIVAHERCLRRFSTDVPRTLQSMREQEPGLWDDIELHPPNLIFKSFLALDLGGVTMELHHLPGHAVDCIVGWLPEWGVLLGGDAIETPFPVVNSIRALPRWLEALRAWADNSNLCLAIPAHGSFSGRQCLDRTLDYLTRLQNGDDFDLPEELEPFYQQTHLKNLRLVHGAPSQDA